MAEFKKDPLEILRQSLDDKLKSRKVVVQIDEEGVKDVKGKTKKSRFPQAKPVETQYQEFISSKPFSFSDDIFPRKKENKSEKLPEDSILEQDKISWAKEASPKPKYTTEEIKSFYNGTKHYEPLEQSSIEDYFPNINSKGTVISNVVEEEESVNPDEEVIVLISELADYYTVEELTKRICDFSIDKYPEEYAEVFEKHCETIISFKRNKNA